MRGMSVNNAMDMAVQLEGTLGRFAQPFMALGLLSAVMISANGLVPIAEIIIPTIRMIALVPKKRLSEPSVFQSKSPANT